MNARPNSVDLSVQLGRLQLPNPILVASGTFGYAREMEHIVDLSRLGGVIPKTITREPRQGNSPWRTVETTGGLLNSIGLDNDGLDAFVEHHLPYLADMPCPLIVSVAGRTHDEFVSMVTILEKFSGIDAIELNVSCPNVSHGIDFASDAEMCGRLISDIRHACSFPILAKLTPNVTNISKIAEAAATAGADAICVINTLLGMVVNWRMRRPMLGNGMGGLSGPAIKPVALRCVYQVAKAVDIPVVGIGGIASIDDAMEFFVAGATAVQIGTANYYDPTVSVKVVEALPDALQEVGAKKMQEVVGSLRLEGSLGDARDSSATMLADG